MKSIKIIFIFVFSLLLSTELGISGEDFHQWCRRTTHSQICISIIAQSPVLELKTAPSGFCLILNDKAKDISGSVLGKISNILKGSSINSSDKQLLQDVYALYVDIDYIVYNLYFSALNHENYLSYSRDLQKAILGVVKSNAIFRKVVLSAYERSLFVKENEMLGIVIEIMVQILNLNECNKIQTCAE